MTQTIKIIQGDITTFAVDAIVNAASPALLGGGGVDGVIHRGAGDDLVLECKKLNGCDVGKAKKTKAYNLPANFIFHTVGPKLSQYGLSKSLSFLRSCYSSSFELAIRNNVKSISFPSIATGVYGCPKKESATIAVEEALCFLNNNKNYSFFILFVLHSREMFFHYKSILLEKDLGNVVLEIGD